MQGESVSFSVSAEEAEHLIAAHDGDVALLWLFLRQHPGGTPEDAARALCRTRAEVEAAREKLLRLRLPDLEGAGAPASDRTPPPLPIPEPAEELPEYTAADLTARCRNDTHFAAIRAEAERVLGRKLNSSELKKLLGLYDYLALPPEVLMMLLNYCAANTPFGNPPSLRYIEKEAYAWANREILTLDQAEAYIAASRRLREKLAQAAKALNIAGREPTATERKYLSAWLEMGFDEEVLGIAYDRTVTNTGALKWKYMDGILQSWHKKGLHTPAEIRDKDRRPGDRTGKAEAPRNMDKLLAALDKI